MPGNNVNGLPDLENDVKPLTEVVCVKVTGNQRLGVNVPNIETLKLWSTC